MAASPQAHPSLSASDLLCKLTGADLGPAEDAPYRAPGVLDGTWVVLGAGHGLRVWIESDSVDGRAEPRVRIEPASERVGVDAWERSF